MQLTENIHRHLRRKRLNQAELARRMGKAPATIHALVHGRGSPRLSTLERLAAALGTSVAALVGGRPRQNAVDSVRDPLAVDSQHDPLGEGP